MAPSFRFAVLTDLHFVPAGERLYGFDPRDSLRRALAFLETLPQVDALVLAGDLADRGETAAYRSLHSELSGLPFPVIPMLGNHDNRENFRSVFSEAPRDTGGFVQSVHVFPQASLIALDTLCEDEPGHFGALCPDRLEWLEQALRAVPADRPVLLFQHHPPMELAIPPMDAIRLRDAPAELAAFDRAGRRPDYLFMGHVHRPISGLWQGIPFHVQRALMHQVFAEFDVPGRIVGSIEAPDLSWVGVSGGQILIHDCSFTYDGPAFDLENPAAAAVSEPGDLGRL